MSKLSFALAICLFPLWADAKGVYSEADLGATLFLGSAGKSAAPGPSLGARIGYQPASWIGLGVLLSASVHEATVPPPPEDEFFQLYHMGMDLRFRVRAGRIGLFAEGSGGVAVISTNVLDSVGLTSSTRHLSPYLLAGGGVEYHTQNPRFGLGLAGDWAMYTDFSAMQTVSIRFYLRYTR